METDVRVSWVEIPGKLFRKQGRTVAAARMAESLPNKAAFELESRHMERRGNLAVLTSVPGHTISQIPILKDLRRIL